MNVENSKENTPDFPLLELPKSSIIESHENFGKCLKTFE